MDENFTELKGEIAGPPDTPYEGEGLMLDTLLSANLHAWFHNFLMCVILGITLFL